MHADHFADLSRRLESLIRLGTVAEVDHAAARVRVRSGGLLTTWLPWLTHRAGDTRSWCPPTVGEQVLLLCPSGEPGAGIVLPAIYADARPAPDTSASTHVVTFPDGARVCYDHASSHLDVQGIKTATVQASELVTVDVPETRITGNVTIDGNLLVLGTATITKLLSYLAGLAGFGTGGGTARTVIRGPIEQIEGGYTTTHDVVAGGISLRSHTHPENGMGGGTTGAPQ